MNALSAELFDAPDRTADLRGMQCPLPALKTGRRLREMQPGTCLVVLADDPLAPLDIANLCREQGHVLLAQRDGEGEHEVHFAIRRGR